MKLTEAQRKALTLAAKNSGVYAGWNPGGHTVGANTIRSLAKLGLLTIGKTTQNETWGLITLSGVEVLGESS